MTSNDARGPLTRRFTTNALPTLSPIGQQRRQAAGDTQMVSTTFHFQLHEQREAREGESIMDRAGVCRKERWDGKERESCVVAVRP